jgi:protein O-GlcNAc transferase
MSELNTESAFARIEELSRQGAFQQAEERCKEVLKSAPREHKAWNWLGTIALKGGCPADAEIAFRQATALEPNDAAYWSNLAVSIHGQRRLEEAEVHFRHALKLDESRAYYWDTLATCLGNQARWPECLSAAQRALACDPNYAPAWNNVGLAEQELGRLSEAQHAFERSLAIVPNDLTIATKYGHVLLERGEWQRGMGVFQLILARDTGNIAAWLTMARALHGRGSVNQAEAAYSSVLAIAPHNVEALFGLAYVKALQWSLSEAEAVLHRVLADNPASAEAWSLLGSVLSKQARGREAMIALRRSIAIAPSADRHSVLLQKLHYQADVTPEQLLEEHRRWDTAYARSLFPPVSPLARSREGTRPLRLGFVSSDFWRSAVGLLSLRALECLDKSQCTLVCYSDRPIEDDYQMSFRSTADLWRDTGTMSDEVLAAQIRNDEVDVLFDLMGHVSRRLLVFARKPAPMQVSWLGYVGTTGMAAMDFVLADRFHVRPGEEKYFVESILRMPNGYACYSPPSDAPDVGPLPALSCGHVTFGCFNNPMKFTPQTFDLWAAILGRVPNAKLLLKYGGLQDPKIQERVQVEFVRRGILPPQVLFQQWSPLRESLAAYAGVDLALDTQPYSGGVTTCEAMWMGVPVITFPGRIFASRHSLSHLTNAGYPQFVANDPAGYVELAVEWANRLDELARIRSTMRDQVRQSLLCDAPRFAHDFLSVLTEACGSRIANR